MKQLLLLIFLFGLLLSKTFAANNSFKIAPFNPHVDSLSITRILSLSPQEVKRLTGYKLNLIERLEWKILQKKLKKNLGHPEVKKSKDTISTIALITGVLGLILLFIVPGVGFILLLIGIITGIIGLNNNDNPKSRRKALIGLIAGIVGVLLTLIALIAFVSGGWF